MSGTFTRTMTGAKGSFLALVRFRRRFGAVGGIGCCGAKEKPNCEKECKLAHDRQKLLN